ncbi:hypothetical protein BASA81_007128 [Batrachochytrium salamandrivorans]|nr:hypothetical protein BASA81_007128 [Batrachochytrium salamandrivorans]
MLPADPSSPRSPSFRSRVEESRERNSARWVKYNTRRKMQARTRAAQLRQQDEGNEDENEANNHQLPLWQPQDYLFWTRHYRPLSFPPRDTGWQQEKARILSLALAALI